MGLQDSKSFLAAHPDIQGVLNRISTNTPTSAQAQTTNVGLAFSQAVTAAGMDWNQIDQWKAEYQALPAGTGARTSYLATHPGYLRYLNLADAWYGNSRATTLQQAVTKTAAYSPYIPHVSHGQGGLAKERSSYLRTYNALMKLPRFQAAKKQAAPRKGLPARPAIRYG